MRPNFYYNAFENVVFKFKVKDEKEIDYCLKLLEKYAKKSVIHEIKHSNYPKDDKILWLMRHVIYNDFEACKKHIDPYKSYYYDLYIKDKKLYCKFLEM